MLSPELVARERIQHVQQGLFMQPRFAPSLGGGHQKPRRGRVWLQSQTPWEVGAVGPRLPKRTELERELPAPSPCPQAGAHRCVPPGPLPGGSCRESAQMRAASRRRSGALAALQADTRLRTALRPGHTDVTPDVSIRSLGAALPVLACAPPGRRQKRPHACVPIPVRSVTVLGFGCEKGRLRTRLRSVRLIVCQWKCNLQSQVHSFQCASLRLNKCTVVSLLPQSGYYGAFCAPHLVGVPPATHPRDPWSAVCPCSCASSRT